MSETGDFGISASELASMRATRLAAYPDLMRVERNTNDEAADDDAIGGAVTDWDLVPNLAAVPCKLAPASGREQPIVAKLTALTAWVVTFPPEFVLTIDGTPTTVFVDVDSHHRLIIDGRTLQIEAVTERPSIEVSRRAVCTEILL
jgi:hypothetical protein